MFDNLWTYKYQPKSLDDIILSKQNYEYFNSVQEEIPNLLFVGPPGIGKSSLAKIITQNILQCQYLYINASDENGIDTIRSKVINFAQTKSVDGKIKVVVLDEFDGMSPEGMRALRNPMEEYATNTRFILTANYKHKIIPAIQSRSEYFDLTPAINDILKHIVHILKNENINVNSENIKVLGNIVRDCYPDIRRTINTVHKACFNGKIEQIEIQTNDLSEIVYKHIKDKDIISLREHLIKNENAFQGDYNNLLKSFLNYIYNLDIKYDNKCQIILTVSEYLYKDAIVLDKEINAFACWTQLQQVIL